MQTDVNGTSHAHRSGYKGFLIVQIAACCQISCKTGRALLRRELGLRRGLHLLPVPEGLLDAPVLVTPAICFFRPAPLRPTCKKH